MSTKTTITAILFSLFDELGLTATVAMAREVAAAAELNVTSAEIAFYHWRKARGFYIKSAPALAR